MRYFSTFSGIGGFELGINGKCVGFSEVDKYAIQIYKKHFPNHKNYGDITAIDTATLPDFDCFVGGFPCQSFSIAGKRGGFDDTRGTLFFECARIIRDKRPRNFVLENVKGLLSHEKGQTFKTIIRTLTELGYCVEWQVLNSKNFGVPQNRERVFIVGHLGGELRRKVFPFFSCDSVNGKVQQVKRGKRTWASCLNTRYGQRWTDESYIKQGDRIRKLTPLECERLQGFPDVWTDGVGDVQRYKTIGNAVTVDVIREIFKKLF